MFKIESYVTPILLSYVDKYVEDFKPIDAQVSLWAGGVVLHNLILKTDVIQQELSLPFTLISGRIHELLIQVPWTKIMSEPIVVTIDTIECILGVRPHSESEETPLETQYKAKVVEAPPGYMQALVRRIVSNISLKINHLILKYVVDDIVMSLNVKEVSIDSAGVNWEPAFADIDQNDPVLRRLIKLDDLTLCLDSVDSDGKIRFYQEPLLYRCELKFRVLSRLASATTRRAISHNIQISSSKLAWGVTNEQLALLLRMIEERSTTEASFTLQVPPRSPTAQAVASNPVMSVSDINNGESWSEWAWSWLPSFSDKYSEITETPLPATPSPFYISAYLDSISLVFKIMEKDSAGKKRPRSIMELTASYAALKGVIQSPLLIHFALGARNIVLLSSGKCCCGLFDYNAARDNQTKYLSKISSVPEDKDWSWPEHDIECLPIFKTPLTDKRNLADEETLEPDAVGNEPQDNPPPQNEDRNQEFKEDGEISKDEFWIQMEPMVFVDFSHERSPPTILSNPYESPPKDFQYSDWVEHCTIYVSIEPMELAISTGLIHRVNAILNIFKSLPPQHVPDISMQTLTVEECEALLDNLPQRRTNIQWRGIRIRLMPCDHATVDRAAPSPIYLDIEAPKLTVYINAPLYPHRVCSAACQMPLDDGPMWQGARMHITVCTSLIQVSLNSINSTKPPRSVARMDLSFVIHHLLHEEYFSKRDLTNFSYSFNIKEASLCGSAPRLQTAFHALKSIIANTSSNILKNTSLSRDAFCDEDLVAVDVTVEELLIRGFSTNNINTHNVTLQSVRATALHAPRVAELKQAWLLSAPDLLKTTPFLRIAHQYCKIPATDSIDYIGIWTEPAAMCLDPLFVIWLGYKPYLLPLTDPVPSSLPKTVGSSTYISRKRPTPSSSSGRGVSKNDSGTELVHTARPRSLGSSSGLSERKDLKTKKLPPDDPWWVGNKLLALYKRLQYMLLRIEIGMVMLYVNTTTASAVDCETIRDALERHAKADNWVLAMSLGRLVVHSNATMKHFWQDIRHDGPTISSTKFENKDECFPWKMRLADMSCYTLELLATSDISGKESARGLRSQLKVTSCVAVPRPILELFTTTITLSVVTKTVPQKNIIKKDSQKKNKPSSSSEERVQYFTSGMEFKPATLQDFVRGPVKRSAKSPETKSQASKECADSSGPVVSLGVCLHADTPPIIVKIDIDQVNKTAGAIHCIRHALLLLNQEPPTWSSNSDTTCLEETRKNLRSDNDERKSFSEETASDSRSDTLISIFEAQEAPKLKASFWFQWVISRVSINVATGHIKIVFEIEDAISTVDLQTHYNQFKTKISSVSIRHYEWAGDNDWTCGPFGGKVFEASEPTTSAEESPFLSVTITQAQISNLPESWKEELHPNMIQSKSKCNTMWEIYATLAPLDVVLRSTVLNQILQLINEMTPRFICPLKPEPTHGSRAWQWPFCYFSAGGLQVLLTLDKEINSSNDDTLMFIIGKISINPHPENPICRRTAATCTDGGWLSAGGGFEGRQYELSIKNIKINSSKFMQLVSQDEQDHPKGVRVENPALKWATDTTAANITTILHSVKVGCVLAPALLIDAALVCGPGVEINIMSDFSLDISVAQLRLMSLLSTEIQNSFTSNVCNATFDEDMCAYCPYAFLSQQTGESSSSESSTGSQDIAKAWSTFTKKHVDSGVETSSNEPSTVKSSKPFTPEANSHKKSFSVAFIDEGSDHTDNLEVFITVGVVEFSLYAIDDDSHLMSLLRPPHKPDFLLRTTVSTPVINTRDAENEEHKSSSLKSKSVIATKSMTDNTRTYENTVNRIQDNGTTQVPTKKPEGTVSLFHVTLHQPNLYYYKQRHQKTLQVSLFNIWIAFGSSLVDSHWHKVLLSTRQGDSDPVTDIPPAFATMKLIVPRNAGGLFATSGAKGTMRLDIERPIMVEVSVDNLRRILAISSLIESAVINVKTKDSFPTTTHRPFLYRLRRSMGLNSLDVITINVTQFGITGEEGAVGWDSASLQIAASARPERLIARGLVTAFLVSVGASGDNRRPLLHPLMLGVELECSWEAWRRAEGGAGASEPSIRCLIDLDQLTVDLRPEDLEAFYNLKEAFDTLASLNKDKSLASVCKFSVDSDDNKTNLEFTYSMFGQKASKCSLESEELADHYYKDDLRSGAFKYLRGGQLPMAYQVMLQGDSVSWRYPHPRTITRIVAFPLPDENEEVDCVLEHYSKTLSEWIPHIYFKLPVSESCEIKRPIIPPVSTFAHIWRFRLLPQKNEEERHVYVFNAEQYMPRPDPLVTRPQANKCRRYFGKVTAEQLSGVLRVDSYFSPSVLPQVRGSVRFAALNVYMHNSIPNVLRMKTSLEGYYVSKPLVRSHRMLSLNLSNTTAFAQMSSAVGLGAFVETTFSSNVIDSASGAFEELIRETRAECGVSLSNNNPDNNRLRFYVALIQLKLHVPRIRTLQSLIDDWNIEIAKAKSRIVAVRHINISSPELVGRRAYTDDVTRILEGRVSLWIHNEISVALRVGQVKTDDISPLGAGVKLAYRWRNPQAPKKIQFALAGPSNVIHWSNSIDLTVGESRICMEDTEELGGGQGSLSAGIYLHTRVTTCGAKKILSLYGRLTIANMLRYNLQYKVRARCSAKHAWKTIMSSEIKAETVGLSIVCGAECDLVLKIKFANDDIGWSGDIPMKECHKENVPWLVKVPSGGDLPYMSIWCRVVRARSDGRILATLWPLYILRSYVPLDIDVQVATEKSPSVTGETESATSPIVQTAPGRGHCTHLLAPGTTSAMHMLTFQYKNIDTPVTRDRVPLHYGVTDTSVFDKKVTINSIDEVISDIKKWLEKSSKFSKTFWPYSTVIKHRVDNWQPALLQPRADVTVSYQAVRAGGGCSLEVALRPVALFCNAAPIALTLRAHDAAPLCKVEPGTAIAPPSILLQKPFFVSIEIGRETFVSRELEVWREEVGRYGSPPPGRVAPDFPTLFAINCYQKVAMLTLYYEIIDEINVLGVSATFVVINRLEMPIMVSTIAIPNLENSVLLNPQSFKLVPVLKNDSNVCVSTSLCNFSIHGRWRGGDACELHEFICFSFPDGESPAHPPVPLRLRVNPVRRPISLRTIDNVSVAVVITQQKIDGRWLIVVAPDPCPQFVIHNKTEFPMTVGQPSTISDEPSTSRVIVTSECSGVRWYCHLEPHSVTHYSSPIYCARYPPIGNTTSSEELQFLTFGSGKDELEIHWCPPVAATSGEQLVQMVHNTYKLIVSPHPHSTLLEIQNVDENDISASDIRRRLVGQPTASMKKTAIFLARTDATDQLFIKSNIKRQTDYQDEIEEASENPICYTEPKLIVGNVNITLEDEVSGMQSSATTVALMDGNTSEPSLLRENSTKDERSQEKSSSNETISGTVSGIVIEMAATPDVSPLLVAHLDGITLALYSENKTTTITGSIADFQVDNHQYESGQFDFGVVASTCTTHPVKEPWPPVWSIFCDQNISSTAYERSHLMMRVQLCKWNVVNQTFQEISDVELKAGPLALYIEDAYVSALVAMLRMVTPVMAVNDGAVHFLDEAQTIQQPIRLRTLYIHPLDLTLTLHTAVRMYIALDQSPLRLNAFEMQNLMTSMARLTHALTVHYLSAAILGAGWVVGGLELLGAPGALATRVTNASGGVKGVALTTAAAILRSLSAWASSLARNLDLLAGDEEHTRRAAAARRKPPASFFAGLSHGVTNFAINILGAVGGLAHHPLVGVAVGETDSSTAALRRSLLGAVTKPLSATADLVALAGHGLLRQTGWDPEPQVRLTAEYIDKRPGWDRDCVRWSFRLADLTVLAGFEVLLEGAPLQLLLTHKCLAIAEPDTEKIVEMIDFKNCILSPFEGNIIQILIVQRKQPHLEPRIVDEDMEYQINAVAMIRVARYTGAELAMAASSLASDGRRLLSFLPAPGREFALHSMLAALIHYNHDTHFHLL